MAFNESFLLSMEGMHLYSKLKPVDQVFTLYLCAPQTTQPTKQIKPTEITIFSQRSSVYRLVKVFGVRSCLLQKWPATFHSCYTEHMPFYLRKEGLLKPSIPCSAETQKSKEMGNQIGIQTVPTFHCCSPCSTWDLSCNSGVTALSC